MMFLAPWHNAQRCGAYDTRAGWSIQATSETTGYLRIRRFPDTQDLPATR